MDKIAASRLWKQAAYPQSDEPTVLQGVALARNLYTTLEYDNNYDARVNRRNVAAFLREWADAIDVPPDEDGGG